MQISELMPTLERAFLPNNARSGITLNNLPL